MAGITLKDVCFQFGAKTALDHVSFTVPEGRFTALLGKNGAGKSTLFNILCGLLVAEQGVVEVAGLDINKHALATRRQLGLVFQQNALDLELSILQNLRYFASIQGISKGLANDRIQNVMVQLGLVERCHEAVQKLNGGHRRRLEIARALLHNPAILILDEPTTGLDLTSKQWITDHVHQLTREGGTVLWITHLLDEIRHGDHLVVLRSGQLQLEGEFAALGGAAALEQLLTKPHQPSAEVSNP